MLDEVLQCYANFSVALKKLVGTKTATCGVKLLLLV